MARINGRKGKLYVGLASSAAAAEHVAYLSEWSLDQSTDKVDVTAMGDANKVKVAGLPDASGSYTGFYDTASDQLYTPARDGDPRNFYLYPTSDDTGTYWYGTATFDFSISSSVNGAVGISGSFEASGDVLKVSS